MRWLFFDLRLSLHRSAHAVSVGGKHAPKFFFLLQKKLLDTPIDYAYKPTSPTG